MTCVITRPTRASVQIRPVKPAASGPASSTVATSANPSSDTRRRAPGGPAERNESAPPSTHARCHVDTACGDTPDRRALARDLLQAVLLWLHAGAKADLGRVVGRLDAEFDRRTVPRPGLIGPDSPWGVNGPWRDQLAVE
ncbi:hypothetical protein ACIBSV_42970 [Embleya sp. NPDC050154]|uniref:hypothetical protein n=1 Tax=Embleya sp. NPDC050154 TaxID=3363988 RepID=UPI0037B4D1E0